MRYLTTLLLLALFALPAQADDAAIWEWIRRERAERVERRAETPTPKRARRDLSPVERRRLERYESLRALARYQERRAARQCCASRCDHARLKRERDRAEMQRVVERLRAAAR